MGFEMMRLRFFFEYGVDTVLWPDDVDSELGYPCDLEMLPLSDTVRIEVRRLAERYQSSLDEAYPPGPSPWSLRQQVAFNDSARVLLVMLRKELEPRWVIEDRHVPFSVPI
jgi:hypothetical protein